MGGPQGQLEAQYKMKRVCVCVCVYECQCVYQPRAASNEARTDNLSDKTDRHPVEYEGHCTRFLNASSGT